MTIHFIEAFYFEKNKQPQYSFIHPLLCPTWRDGPQAAGGENTESHQQMCYTSTKKKAQNDSVMKKQETSTALKEDSVSAPLKVSNKLESLAAF